MKEKKSTMIELPIILKEIREKYDKANIKRHITQTIFEAERGEFHDYKNRKYVCGKVAACEHMSRLSQLGVKEAIKIYDDIADGVYDETADEEDEQNMIEDIEGGMPPQQAEKFKKLIGLK